MEKSNFENDEWTRGKGRGQKRVVREQETAPVVVFDQGGDSSQPACADCGGGILPGANPDEPDVSSPQHLPRRATPFEPVVVRLGAGVGSGSIAKQERPMFGLPVGAYPDPTCPPPQVRLANGDCYNYGDPAPPDGWHNSTCPPPLFTRLADGSCLIVDPTCPPPHVRMGPNGDCLRYAETPIPEPAPGPAGPRPAPPKPIPPELLEILNEAPAGVDLCEWIGKEITKSKKAVADLGDKTIILARHKRDVVAERWSIFRDQTGNYAWIDQLSEHSSSWEEVAVALKDAVKKTREELIKGRSRLAKLEKSFSLICQ